MYGYKVVPSLHSVRQPPNLALDPRTKSNPRTVLGWGLETLTVLMFGGLQHAPGILLSAETIPYHHLWIFKLRLTRQPNGESKIT